MKNQNNKREDWEDEDDEDTEVVHKNKDERRRDNRRERFNVERQLREIENQYRQY